MSDVGQSISEKLRDLACDVRRIGNGFRDDPETILMIKDEVAEDLYKIARQLEEN